MHPSNLIATAGTMFTKRSIESLQPTGKQYSVKDEKTPGLILLVTPKGAKTFYSYRWLNGKPERIKLGTFPAMTVEQARNAANAVLGAIATGANPASAKRAVRAELTFNDAFEQYIQRKRNRRGEPLGEGTVNNYRGILANHLAGIAQLRLSQITSEQLRNLKIKSSAQNNMARVVVSAVFNWAHGEGLTDAPCPANAIKNRHIPSRERFLQPSEVGRFLEAVEASSLKDFFLLALLTGARRGNVLAMRWQDIDLEDAVWLIPRTKNGTSQRVALVPEAVQILNARLSTRGVKETWVFPGKGKTGHLVEPKTAWAALFDWDELQQMKLGIEAQGHAVPAKDAEVRALAETLKIKIQRVDSEKLKIHDLRRTLGSWQAREGTSLTIIGKSLNHKSQQATAIYARLDLDPVRASIEQATASLLKAGRGEK